MGRSDPCPPPWALLSHPPRCRLLARRAQGGPGCAPKYDQHVVDVRAARQSGAEQLGAAKSGIATFTQIVAEELSRFDVKVNCIAPVARTRLTLATPGLGDIMAPATGCSTSGTPATLPRLSPTSPRRPADSTVDVLRPRRNGAAGCVRGSSPRACVATAPGPSTNSPTRSPTSDPPSDDRWVFPDRIVMKHPSVASGSLRYRGGSPPRRPGRRGRWRPAWGG